MGASNGEPQKNVEGWSAALRKGLVSGSVASVVSSIALAICGKIELDDPYAPINGPSQWLLGKPARYADGFRIPHTLIGYAIHHAMSVFWAVLFEKALQHHNDIRDPIDALRPAAATSAVAFVVDYTVTPPRLRPGFEKRLSRFSLITVYLAFMAGLAAGTSMRRNGDKRIR